VAVHIAAQKAFQGAKDLGFSRHSLFLLKALGGAAQKQQCPLRVVERLRRKPVFGFENEARLCILPIQPDQLGAPATFFRTRSAVFGRPLPSVMPPNSKRKQNTPQVLKVCPRDCFVISTTRNATTNPRYGFGQIPRLLETKNNRELMKKILLGLSAVVAVLLPLSQNAQAHWVVYRKTYVYHHVYSPHRCWHHGYWSAGVWHPGCWF